MLSNAKLSLKRLVKLRNFVLVSLMALLLSGCVNYDVGVHFDNQHSGQFTQTVKLGDRLAAINGISAQQWLDSLDERARKLQGNTQRISHNELQVSIPFTTDKDFVKKFNRFFEGQPAASDLIETPNVSAQVALQQANWLLILRNHITLDVDLTSLGINSDEEGMLVNPGNLLNLDFHVDAPWGAKYKLRGPNAIAGEDLPNGMVWHMLPGQLNHIEGYFWMPSPLGLYSLGVIGLVVGATYLKKWKDQKAAEAASGEKADAAIATAQKSEASADASEEANETETAEEAQA